MSGDSGTDGGALLSGSRQALEAGHWATARKGFSAVLDRGESAEALFGLGVAVWWLGETEAALRHWESAYVAFRRRAEPERAVLAAVYLCLAYRMSLGNHAASQGWLGRAASLVEEFRLGAVNGWVLVARAYVATDAGRPREGERYAREARAIADRAGDADLTLCAMGELGAALVEMGQAQEGAALLDEAMAGALAGEAGDLDTVVLISCRTVTACSRGGDMARVRQWVRAAEDFHQRYGSPHLYATCRAHYGAILFATGDWAQAEIELQAALEIGKAAEPAVHAEAVAKLAELRLAQGELDEAELLLTEFSDHPVTTCAVAGVHLARGRPVVAVSLLRRRLREVDDASLEGTALLELLIEGELTLGAVREAVIRAERLAAQSSQLNSTWMLARGQRALGRALAPTGEQRAGGHLEHALAAFGRLRMPYEAARTRLHLAQVLAGCDPETAVAEARTALANFEQLGAARDANAAAAFLRSIGVKAARTGPKGLGLLTKREGEVLSLLGKRLSNPEIAAQLFISRKTVEHHVASVLAKLDLNSRGEATVYALRSSDAKSAPR